MAKQNGITESVPQRVKSRVDSYPGAIAQYYKDAQGTYRTKSYEALWSEAEALGSAFLEAGVGRGDHVGIIADNRHEWLVTDLALLSIGAIDVPRGTDATGDEVTYILGHADCRLVVTEGPSQAELLLARKSDLPKMETLLLYDSTAAIRKKIEKAGLVHWEYNQLLESGNALPKESFRKELAAGTPDEVATLIYTSGTTGEPKGVMLTHRSYIFQMDRIHEILHLDETDIFLSVLPIWHSFERAVGYLVLNFAAAIAYSKPIGQVMLEDMAKVRPTWMTSVPRIWEGVRAAVYRNARKESAVKQAMFHFFVGVGESHAHFSNMMLGRLPAFRRRYRALDIGMSLIPLIVLTPFKLLGSLLVFSKLRARLGGRFVAGVSGGGALPVYVDRFFQAAGIKLLEGYGLTESGPVLAVRLQDHPVSGTVGPLLPDVEHRVLDESGTAVPPGHKGVLHVRSEQIMEGYYKKPEATAEVLRDGWLNTGDLVVFTHNGEFTIIGREKDTIVLLGGENVEPGPIEESLVQSDLIEQAMVVGQDQKFLGALIVPNRERLEEFARETGVDYVEYEELLEAQPVNQRMREEIEGLINGKNGFKLYERIYRFALLATPFEVGRELTNTLKIRRTVAAQMHHRRIENLFR